MIQIFGTTKSFDTKKAQMWFKERRIPFQFINLKEKEMSSGEFESVLGALTKVYGSTVDAVAEMIDKGNKDYGLVAYLEEEDKAEKLFENQMLLKMPICRNGKNLATVGLQEKIWEGWK